MNFKHKFLNHLFPGKDLNRAYRVRISNAIDLKTSNYLNMANGDQFNTEIKLLSNGNYIESSAYLLKKEKKALVDMHQKQNEIAAAVMKQESLASGLLISL